mgnify:CR=1 FL=1
MIACPRQNGHAPVAFPRQRESSRRSRYVPSRAYVKSKEAAWFMEPAIMLNSSCMTAPAGMHVFSSLTRFCVVSARADVRKEHCGVKPKTQWRVLA